MSDYESSKAGIEAFMYEDITKVSFSGFKLDDISKGRRAVGTLCRWKKIEIKAKSHIRKANQNRNTEVTD